MFLKTGLYNAVQRDVRSDSISESRWRGEGLEALLFVLMLAFTSRNYLLKSSEIDSTGNIP